MTQHIRLEKCSEARRRIRIGGYNAAHLGLAVDRMVASEFDGSPHDDVLMRGDFDPDAPVITGPGGDYRESYTPRIDESSELDRWANKVLLAATLSVILIFCIALMVL